MGAPHMLNKLALRGRPWWLAWASLCSVGMVDAQPIPPTCEAIQQRPRSLVFESLGALVYPEESFRDGEEGNLVYQYRLVNRSGVIAVVCIVSSTGHPRLDAALLKRLANAKVLLPKSFDWDRDGGTVYQDSNAAGVLAESLRRQKDDADLIRTYEPSDVISAPAPPYPRDAVARGLEGEVTVVARVTAAGAVDGVTLIKSSGHATLDSAAMTAMLFIRFKPRDRAIRIQRIFNFTLS